MKDSFVLLHSLNNRYNTDKLYAEKYGIMRIMFKDV